MRVYEWVSDDTDLQNDKIDLAPNWTIILTAIENCISERKKNSNNMKLLINRQVEQNQSKRII